MRLIIVLVFSLACYTIVDAWFFTNWSVGANLDCLVKLGDKSYSPTAVKWRKNVFVFGCRAAVRKIRGSCNLDWLTVEERRRACYLWCNMQPNCRTPERHGADIKVTKMGKAWCVDNVEKNYVKGRTFHFSCLTLNEVRSQTPRVEIRKPRKPEEVLAVRERECIDGKGLC